MNSMTLFVVLTAGLAPDPAEYSQEGKDTAKTEDVAAVRALMGRHFSALNELDPEKRTAQCAEIYDPHVKLIDPYVIVDGRAELEKLYDGIHQRFPDLRFTVIGDVDVHHDVARIHWALGKPGAAAMQTGDDTVRIKAGRIIEIIVFFNGPSK